LFLETEEELTFEIKDTLLVVLVVIVKVLLTTKEEFTELDELLLIN
jgi:hypothetical protein